MEGVSACTVLYIKPQDYLEVLTDQPASCCPTKVVTSTSGPVLCIGIRLDLKLFEFKDVVCYQLGAGSEELFFPAKNYGAIKELPYRFK